MSAMVKEAERERIGSPITRQEEVFIQLSHIGDVNSLQTGDVNFFKKDSLRTCSPYAGL